MDTSSGDESAGTDYNCFTLTEERPMVEEWQAKCKRLATMLRTKAELERDPEVRAEWQYIARGYLILANQFERNGCKNISYTSFPRIRDLDEGAS